VKALAFSACILAIVGVVAVTGCGGAQKARSAPDVRGQRLDLAEAVLDQAHLDFETRGGGIFGVVSASRWWVCKQVPRPGAMTTSVVLIVDRSCAWSVPDVVGLSLDQAEDVLDEADSPYRVTTESGERPVLESRWEVCEQTSGSGPSTRPVELVVARSCYIPDVEWSSLADAEDVLDSAGLAYDVVTVDGRAPLVKPLWTVCDQEPGAGATGSFVSLYVARDCYADWWDRL
jgi:beta-lactam-binding protein with PASTA domain